MISVCLTVQGCQGWLVNAIISFVANTYTQLYIHVVFAVSGRINFIRPAIEEELYRYITGIVQNKGHKMLAINGMPDHIHWVIGLNPREALSDLIRDTKSNATQFMNGKGWFGGGYAWQSGYGAFSYSRSQLDTVIRYVMNQKSHHLKRSFRQEYVSLLRRFQVDFDERYLFEFYDSRV